MQTSGVITDVSVVIPPCSCFRSPELRHLNSHVDTHRSLFFGKSSVSSSQKLGNSIRKCQSRRLSVRASDNSSENMVPVAPLQLESPVGQFLSKMLQTHPHLHPAAVDQQLENLQTDREAQNQEPPSAQDLLQKRIAEIKEKERQKALEEIIYCLIVQKFVENGISMIPKVSATSNPTGQVDFWPNQEQKLESVHSHEAFEMIESHISLVLGDRMVGPLSPMIQMSKIKLGKLYAASVMYGYFLRRVDQRFQLEQTMKTLPDNFSEGQLSPANKLWDPDSLMRILPIDDSGFTEGGVPESDKGKTFRLRSYVMYLDSETLQRYATIRSKEAFSLIEKQTQALFGRPDIRIASDGSIDASNDEIVSITLAGLTMLVLEAVAFGSFLWDAEGYVESKYHFL